MVKVMMVVAGTLVLAGGAATAQQVSPNGVKTLSPAGAIRSTGTWNLATRAGDFIFVAGMRGIDPHTDTLVSGDEARIRQAFLNRRAHHSEMQCGLSSSSPTCSAFAPRTIIEVHRLNQDDIVEVEGTFYAPIARSRKK
jgi:2-iminobutanoate/2-iminopropanoate deaminase